MIKGKGIMAQIYFVDVATSADSVNGIGSEQSCFNYNQFMVSLATNDETNIDNYYYLKNYRSVSASGTSESPITSEDTSNLYCRVFWASTKPNTPKVENILSNRI